jgi:GDPmannose 4,6-dehydratase
MNTKKIALITGISGQDGSYLTEFLIEKGYEVHGVVRRSSSINRDRLDKIFLNKPESRSKVFLHYADLSDSSSMQSVLAKVMPSEIYNLGAQSHVKISFDIPAYTADVVGFGLLRILDAVRSLGLKTRIYQAGSSEMFGKVVEIPQNENTPFYPRSPYGVAKQYAHWIGVNYRESYDMFVSNGILFNHESPRRGENFVTRKITLAAAAIKLGLEDKLFLGNLEAKRDWGYAKDYVEAMWMMLQHSEPDDFVIATGRTATVREFCEIAFSYLDLDYKNFVFVDEKFYRPAEVELLIGDPSKASDILGWSNKTSLEDLIKIMIDSDLNDLETS